MIKVGILVKKDLYDMSVWSGTTATMARKIENNNTVVPIIIKSTLIAKFFSRLIKIVTLGKYDDNFITRFFRKLNVKKNISRSKFDVLFVPAGSDLLGINAIDKNRKIIYLSDATYKSLLDYYFFNVPLKTVKIRDREENQSLHIADEIILASEWAKNRAINDYSISPQKIHVLKFGANMPDHFNFEFKKEKNTINLLCVGVDWNRKGIETACKTVQILNGKKLKWNFTLTVVGVKQPMNRKYDGCRFVGKLDKNNKRELKRLEEIYSSSDIFILPTKAECAGIVFCEASMFGIPCITYDTGGVSSYVKNGKNGYCLNPNATANDFASRIQLILEKENLNSLSKSTRKLYESELNWDKWGEQFQTLLDSLIKEKAS